MKPIFSSVCAAAVVAAVALSVWADRSDARAEFQANYDRIAKALEKKDIDGVTQFSLPDAHVQYADGKKLTVKEWKELAVKGWADVKEIKSQFKVQDVKVNRGSAVATYSEAHDMVLLDPKEGQEHKVSYQGKWRATLKKTAKGWRTSESVELERRVTRDGAVIDQLPKLKP